MGKLWSVFSELEAGSAKGSETIGNPCILASIVLGVGGAFLPIPANSAEVSPADRTATVSPRPSASPTDSEAAFLSLPAYDLELIPSVQPTPTSNRTRVGDLLHLKVNGFNMAGTTLDFVPNEESVHEHGWEVQIDRNQNLIAVPLKAGNLTLPSFAFKDATGNRVARTNPFSREVGSAIKPSDPKPQEPEAIVPPVGLSFPWWIVVLAGILGLAAFLAVIYAIYRWQKNRTPKRVEKVEVILPEDEVALQSLSHLEKQGLLLKGEFKKHYFQVSEILKNYLGRRFDFNAPESTTYELKVALEEKQELVANDLSHLIGFFGELDRVKFTDYVPAESESAQTIPVAREFVKKTRRLPSVTPITPPGISGSLDASKGGS
jgi:hypothetical protein